MTHCFRICRLVFLAMALSGVVAGPVRAQPATLDDVVVFAKSKIKISSGARQASGHFVVNDPGGLLLVHPTFKTVPDEAPQIVADTVQVIHYIVPGPELFDLLANTIIDTRGLLSLNGTLTQPLGFTLPLFPFPSTPVVTPGVLDIRVNRLNSPQTLPPGDYGIVRVAGKGVLFLEGGTYNMRRFIVGGQAQILAQTTTTINVSERVRFRGRSNFGPADPLMNGRCVTLNLASSRTLGFGLLADATAIVNAPNARMRLGRLGTYRGSFTAKEVIVGRGTVTETLPPLTEACP